MSPPLDPESRREAILAAALELFDERGFHGTAVPAIAEHAGVGAGTLYRNFASKEELVNVLFRHWKREFAERLLASWPGAKSPRERMSAVWRHFCEFAREQPRALGFLELHYHGSYLDAESVALRDGLHQQFRGLVAQLQREQALRGDVDPEVLIAIVEGAFLRLHVELRHGHVDDADKLLEQTERCVWEAIRP
ncbi:TetR/AcrR family transcriptional regulator [Nannocystaceae bacterium ST9]